MSVWLGLELGLARHERHQVVSSKASGGPVVGIGGLLTAVARALYTLFPRTYCP